MSVYSFATLDPNLSPQRIYR